MFGTITSSELKILREEPARWVPVALDIARSHGLPISDPQVFSTGTNLVVALGGDVILKIFPPMLRHQFEAERGSLLLLHGRLSVDVPRLITADERDGWPYLAMTRVRGETGEAAWDRFDDREKEHFLRRIGEVIAEVQRLPPGDLLRLEPAWEPFLARQIQACRARHERLGMPHKFLAGLDDYIADAASLLPRGVAPVILTGEYIPENFIVTQGPDGWRLSGLIDFGDVMTGWGEYDLLGPSVFMAAGRAAWVRSLFHGFGYSDSSLDRSLSRRMMALCLLHRHSDSLRQFRIEGWQKADDLYELERVLWPFGCEAAT
jgi:hygromycin-B 7''-O-kinase